MSVEIIAKSDFTETDIRRFEQAQRPLVADGQTLFEKSYSKETVLCKNVLHCFITIVSLLVSFKILFFCRIQGHLVSDIANGNVPEIYIGERRSDISPQILAGMLFTFLLSLSGMILSDIKNPANGSIFSGFLITGRVFIRRSKNNLIIFPVLLTSVFLCFVVFIAFHGGSPGIIKLP